MTSPFKKIAFNGSAGAFAEQAALSAFPKSETVPCASFAAAFEAVVQKKADGAMIPIENSIAGRVADVHHLLPQFKLYAAGEHFEPIHHCLVGLKDAKISGLKRVFSHPQALAQCQKSLQKLKVEIVATPDTATAATMIAYEKNPTFAALSSKRAADLNGLSVLQKDMQDEKDNTTRFLIFSREMTKLPITTPAVTSILFRLRSVPAALYKALGGFATNGIDLTKIESYLLSGFKTAQFYIDVDAHIDAPAMVFALDELKFFAEEIQIIGCYAKHSFRHQK